MTKRHTPRTRIAFGFVLLLISLFLFLYWGTNLMLPGDVASAQKIYILPSLVLPIGVFIVAMAILPGGLKKFFTGLQLKTAAFVLMIAAAVSFVTVVIPFPADSPACCMTGPSRERGLPISFGTTHKEFGDASEPYPPLQYNVGWLLADVVVWSMVILYIYRVRNIMTKKGQS